jgi:F-type H+-transporting ATPase subunit a
VEELGPKVEELIGGLKSFEILSASPYFALTSYLVFTLLAVTFLITFFAVARRGLGLVPRGRTANMAEALVGFVRNDIAGEIIGHGSDKYLPFIGTIFFFVLFNNLLGLVPGAKPGTGSLGITITIGLIVFVFFNGAGFKEQGFLGYMGSLVPAGVPGWISPLVWLIEFVSILLRPITLAVRLFANMFAGHIILGVFAILVELAVEPLIHAIQTGQGLGGGAFLSALPAVVWMALLVALYALEVLVAFIQAYVFALLTTVYIGSAVHEH